MQYNHHYVSLKTSFCCNPVLANVDVATEKCMLTVTGEEIKTAKLGKTDETVYKDREG